MTIYFMQFVFFSFDVQLLSVAHNKFCLRCWETNCCSSKTVSLAIIADSLALRIVENICAIQNFLSQEQCQKFEAEGILFGIQLGRQDQTIVLLSCLSLCV